MAEAFPRPVAVIGLACRLPRRPTPPRSGGCCATARDAITEAPAGPLGRATPVTHAAAAASSTRSTGSTPAFFGISPREAAAMDPQQRLDAGAGLGGAGGRRHRARPRCAAAGPACSSAPSADDYATLLDRHGRRRDHPHTMTGLHRGIIANRVSYTLGLRGPSLTVDTGAVLVAGRRAPGLREPAPRRVRRSRSPAA